jgi:hypothetical protein
MKAGFDVHDSQHSKLRSTGPPVTYCGFAGGTAWGSEGKLPRCGYGSPTSGTAHT